MLDEDFIRICKESETMSRACSKIGIHFNTFRAKNINGRVT